MLSEVRDELASIEERLQERVSKDHDHWYKQINSLQRNLSETEKSRLWAEQHSLNVIARHLSHLQTVAQTRLDENDDFLRGLPDLERRRGKAGAYEEAVRELRQSQLAFMTVFSVIQEQKLLWDTLIKRLQDQQ